MSDNDPIDLDAADAVVADDALVERLRHALSPDAAVVWDDDDEDSDDLSYGLLRALQRDVSADLPAPAAAGRRASSRSVETSLWSARSNA